MKNQVLVYVGKSLSPN